MGHDAVNLIRDAHTVLLPTIDGLTMPDWLPALLQAGTRSVLLAESRQEYVTRRMTADRQATETTEHFAALTTAIRREAGSEVLIAVDQEPWGIQRLHRLVPQLPSVTGETTSPELDNAAFEVATAARQLGVNTFLSPVVDRLSATNPWLQDRTLTLSPSNIGRLAFAYIRGAQRAGVATVVKHFPGFPAITADPALDLAQVPLGAHTPQDLIPFQMSIEAGALAVMAGPAPVMDLDPEQPASTSTVIVDMLRHDMHFTGLIVSDDLDAPATLKGRTEADTAIAAIRAGVGLLLLPGSSHVSQVAQALADEASHDTHFAQLLETAASHVRMLISTLTAG